jgi:hypothetical protein
MQIKRHGTVHTHMEGCALIVNERTIHIIETLYSINNTNVQFPSTFHFNEQYNNSKMSKKLYFISVHTLKDQNYRNQVKCITANMFKWLVEFHISKTSFD